MSSTTTLSSPAMAESDVKKPVSEYQTRVSGLWSSRHTLVKEGDDLGVLSMDRSATGTVTTGTYTPEKGEVLIFRRDPGLLRSQFSMWTDGREWLGSSLRWSYFRRDVNIHNGGKPFRLMPLAGFQRGYALYAPKTGENARISMPAIGRAAQIQVFRRLDFSLMVFAYFISAQLIKGSLWPGPSAERAKEIAEQSAI